MHHAVSLPLLKLRSYDFKTLDADVTTFSELFRWLAVSPAKPGSRV
jgi:hypothetical protein